MITRCLPPSNLSWQIASRMLRKFKRFLAYDLPDLLVILVCTGILLVIWLYFFG